MTYHVFSMTVQARQPTHRVAIFPIAVTKVFIRAYTNLTGLVVLSAEARRASISIAEHLHSIFDGNPRRFGGLVFIPFRLYNV